MLTKEELMRIESLPDNAMLKHHPELLLEWDFEKNIGLDVYRVTKGKGEKVWWKCKEGHPWDAFIYSRTSKAKHGCPVCSGRRVLIGFNDMWTTNPELASMLADPQDGYKYMQRSNKKVDWKCLSCGNIIKNKSINTTYRNQRPSCGSCSDTISYGERFVYNILRSHCISFDWDKQTKWSQGKRYDFYLPDYNWIIEVHGAQHYGKSFSSLNPQSQTAQEVQENDMLKERIARDNGIENYITINANVSSLQHLRESIEESDLMYIVKDIDFKDIGRKSNSSLVKVASDIWSSGMKSTTEIGRVMGLDVTTVINYLKKGKEIGLCDYSVEISRKIRGKKSRKKVVQVDENGVIVKEWNSTKDIADFYQIKPSRVSNAIARKNRLKGFYWRRVAQE